MLKISEMNRKFKSIEVRYPDRVDTYHILQMADGMFKAIDVVGENFEIFSTIKGCRDYIYDLIAERDTGYREL